MNFWQKTLTLTTFLSLTIAGIPFSQANAQVGYESSCREVATSRNNLNVRRGPSTSTAVVGSLPPGTTVIIKSEIGDWIPITEPANGYVASRYLRYCRENPQANNTTITNTNASNTASTCRQVSQYKVAPIRESPSGTSPIISTIQAGRRMAITNLGANGWVPVSEPITGYVSSTLITRCN